MAPLPSKPGLVKCVIGLTMNGIPAANVFHVWDSAGGDFSQTEVDALAQGVFVAYHTNFKASMQAGTAATSCVAQSLASITSPVGSFTGSVAGTNSGTVMPNSLACVISWKTQRRYRGGHGRTYFGGLPNNAFQGATLFDGNYCAILSAAANAFRLAIPLITLPAARTVVLAIPHYRRNGALLNPPEVDIVTGQGVNNKVDTQRRRLTS
jgi:hypothetical protein